MSSLAQVCAPQIATLEHETFGGLGCTDHGLVVLQGATSWNAHERGCIELPTPQGSLVVPLAYDEREAPYAVRPDGREQTDLLLSLADEEDYLACTWARVTAQSPLLGVGVDLSAHSHFVPRTRGRDFSLLLFTEHERGLESALCADDAVAARSILFAAKEAAFKACARPLRAWYEHESDELAFEVRHFVMEEPGLERGTGRNGAAQRAMDRMGIRRMVVRQAQVAGMALVTAVALGV